MAKNTHQQQDHSLPLPITQVARKIAQEFATQVPSPQRQEQIKFNTLAVCVVNDYLQMMGIETNLAAGDSWNPVVRLCADVADLEVIGVGRLECRWVRSRTAEYTLPPDVWEDRVGYVVVQFGSLHEATLLGFTPNATAQLSLDTLQPLENLLTHLHNLQLPVAATSSVNPPVKLHQWFNRVFETRWQEIEAILTPQRTNLALSFRRSDHGKDTNANAENRVRRAKLIDLGMQLAGNSVALLVELRSESLQKIDILIQVHPTGSQLYLPPQLQLIVLDAAEQIFLEAQARKADNYIQLQFSGKPGEKFSVKVALGNDSIIENFVI